VHGVLADCEGISGGARVAWIVLPPLLVVLWAGFAYLALRGTRDEDKLVIASVLGISLLVSLGVIAALSGNDSGNHVDIATPLILAGLACIFIAALVGVAMKRNVYRLSGAALLGSLAPPGAALLYLVWILAINGTCLD